MHFAIITYSEPLKRTFSILLLCLFAFNLAGFFFVFKVQQYRIRREIKQYIKQGVPENELALITVTPENENQLDWKHKKEFRYKGTMYDVVRKEIINKTTIIYHCVTDTQETVLFAHLDEMVSKNMDPKNDQNSPVKNLLKQLSIPYYPPEKPYWSLFQIYTAIIYEYTFLYSSPSLNIISPPPKIV